MLNVAPCDLAVAVDVSVECGKISTSHSTANSQLDEEGLTRDPSVNDLVEGTGCQGCDLHKSFHQCAHSSLYIPTYHLNNAVLPGGTCEVELTIGVAELAECGC